MTMVRRWQQALHRWRGLRRQWLLLAAAIATQNMAVLLHTQGAPASVMALLIWAGALICLEDRLPLLRPRVPRWQLLSGGLLLLWVLARTALASHWDGVVFALAPLSGVGLLLLGVPWQRWGQCREALLCLLMLPAYALMLRVLPEQPLSLLTAQGAGLVLSSLGQAVHVQQRDVLLPGGGVTVLGACNGLDLITQLLCMAGLFALVFPLRSRRALALLALAIPVLGAATNTLRVALLAVVAGAGHGKGSLWFDFFHDQAGSLLFSAVATVLLGWLYLQLLERQLLPRQQP